MLANTNFLCVTAANFASSNDHNRGNPFTHSIVFEAVNVGQGDNSSIGLGQVVLQGHDPPIMFDRLRIFLIYIYPSQTGYIKHFEFYLVC